VLAADAPPRTPVSPFSLPPELLPRVLLPPTTYPSTAQLSASGVYLLEHAAGLFLLVGLEADEEFVGELFGPSVLNALQVPSGALPVLGTPLSLRVWTIITSIRARRAPYLPLTVIGPGDAAGFEAVSRLFVEDKVGESDSYVDLLCEMHKAIQGRLTART